MNRLFLLSGTRCSCQARQFAALPEHGLHAIAERREASVALFKGKFASRIARVSGICGRREHVRDLRGHQSPVHQLTPHLPANHASHRLTDRLKICHYLPFIFGRIFCLHPCHGAAGFTRRMPGWKSGRGIKRLMRSEGREMAEDAQTVSRGRRESVIERRVRRMHHSRHLPSSDHRHSPTHTWSRL